MDNRNSALTPTIVDEIEILLDESASVAQTIGQLAAQIINQDGPNLQNNDIIYLADAIFHLAGKAGWIADFGLQNLGRGPGKRGGPVNWLLSLKSRIPNAEVANG